MEVVTFKIVNTGRIGSFKCDIITDDTRFEKFNRECIFTNGLPYAMEDISNSVRRYSKDHNIDTKSVFEMV